MNATASLNDALAQLRASRRKAIEEVKRALEWPAEDLTHDEADVYLDEQERFVGALVDVLVDRDLAVEVFERLAPDLASQARGGRPAWLRHYVPVEFRAARRRRGSTAPEAAVIT